MAFKFKFEVLLKQRKRLMEHAQVEYAEAQNAVNLKLNEINERYELISDTRTNFHSLTQNMGNYSMEQEYNEVFIKGTGQIIEGLKVEARELMAIAEERHQELVDKTKDYKIIEKLKEKKKEEYKKERRKKENLELEDINIMRFKRGHI